MSGTDYTPLLTTPQVRQLAVAMKVNGQPAPGLVQFATQHNNNWAADTFTATVALDGTAGNGPDAYGPPFWASQGTLELELLASLSPDEAQTSIILGLVDSLQWSTDQQVLELRGRDYTSRFIDTRSAEKYLNKTSSQVATALAAAQQMQASVQATTTLVGSYYKGDAALSTDRITQWQLLTNLAEREGFDLWVAGRTLYFQPPAATPPLKLSYAYADATGTVRSNVPRLTFERNLTLAADIKVRVISWNHEQKKPVTATATGTKTNAPKSGGPKLTPGSDLPAQTFVFRVPGLTQPQALAYAQKKLAELSKHERKASAANLPLILGLTARGMIEVAGTLTDWDQQYFVEEIDKVFGVADASMSIRAKNSSPQAVQTS